MADQLADRKQMTDRKQLPDRKQLVDRMQLADRKQLAGLKQLADRKQLAASGQQHGPASCAVMSSLFALCPSFPLIVAETIYFLQRFANGDG